MPINKGSNKGITRVRLETIISLFLNCTEADYDKGAEEREKFADYIEKYFDDLADEDYFGTEGQLHPFGDKRND